MSGNKFHLPWNSLRFKILFSIMLITFSLLALMVVSNLYAINVVRNQVAMSNQNMVSLYMEQINIGLDDVEQYLFTLMVSNNNFQVIESSNALDEISIAMVRLQDTLSSTLIVNNNIEAFFVYHPESDRIIDVIKRGSAFSERESIRTFITGYLTDRSEDERINALWLVQQLENEYYLFRFFRSGNVYIGAWVSADTLQKPLLLLDIGENGTALLTTSEGVPMNHVTFIDEQSIDLSLSQYDYSMTGKDKNYLVLGSPSRKGAFNLVAVIPDEKILQNLPRWIKFDLLIIAAFVLLIPVFFLLLRRTVVLPINRIITAMKRYGEGDVQIRLDNHRVSEEFMILNRTFNQMASQNQELKISVYEEQLLKQKAELQQLQLQINPHFFMNSLNIIYSFARSGKFDLIQEMVICLVKYFRFMFRSNLTFIALKDELDHVRNYLRIQEIRYPNTLHCEIAVPDSLADIKIPPLMIHTFVENTILHEVSMNDPVDIFISAELDESTSEPDLVLTIRDTGHGFKPEILAELAVGNRIIDEQGEHIGIWNIRKRLQLLYNNKAKMMLANAEPSGAIIRIQLPVFMTDGA